MPLRTVGIGDRGAPAVARWIVFFVIADAAIVVAVDAAGDGVEFAVDDADGVMIPRRDHAACLLQRS